MGGVIVAQAPAWSQPLFGVLFVGIVLYAIWWVSKPTCPKCRSKVAMRATVCPRCGNDLT